MAEYTPIYVKPYEQWKELPTKETLVTKKVLEQYDKTFEHIEGYLNQNPISSGSNGGSTGDFNKALENKVDKVDGKGLSSNDFTNNEKLKLDGISAGADVSVNADWNAASGKSQILNKPTNLSDFQNDSGFVDKAVSDLSNYYLKSQTYTQEEINQRISAIPKFAIEVVESLPVENISPTTIYLLLSGSSIDTDLYTEYIYANSSWEKLGTQTVDLSNYLTKTGDSKDNIVTFVTSDTNTVSEWTDFDTLQPQEKHSTLLNKISVMAKNLRFLWKLIGSNDISGIADGTITGALVTQNSNFSESKYNLGDAINLQTGTFMVPADGYIFLSSWTENVAAYVDVFGKVAINIMRHTGDIGGSYNSLFVKKGMKCNISLGSGDVKAAFFPLV